MRSTFKVIGLALTGLAAVSLPSLRDAEKPSQIIKDDLIRKAEKFQVAVERLQKSAAYPLQIQERFSEARYAYKRMEWAVEYFDPITARLVNGPPVPEAELNGQIIQPTGLQVVEQCIYPEPNPAKQRKLSTQLAQLAANAAEFTQFFKKADLQDWQIIDALKQEVFWVEVLGLNDFDDPIQKNCFDESAIALQALKQPLDLYKADVTIETSIYNLKHAGSFTSFDRASFIKKNANQLTKGITKLQNRLLLMIRRDAHFLNRWV